MPRGKGISRELIQLLNENVGVGFYVCDLAAMLGVSEAAVRRRLESLRMKYPGSIRLHKHYGRALYVIEAPIPQES
jgi:predicted ArsR family transcriptional regulator